MITSIFNCLTFIWFVQEVSTATIWSNRMFVALTRVPNVYILDRMFYCLINRYWFHHVLFFPGNHIKELPDSLCKLQSLRMLDIQENDITTLPQQLCHMRTLETLVVDAHKMKYPSAGKAYVLFYFLGQRVCINLTVVKPYVKVHIVKPYGKVMYWTL